MSYKLVELVSGLRPEDAGRVDELFPRARRIELFEEIVSSDRPITAESGQRRLTPLRRTRRLPSMIRRVRHPVLISSFGVLAAVAVAAGLIVVNSAMRPQAAGAGVAFRTVAHGDIIATVTDPFAAESQLKAAFAEHGFDITLDLMPASPSAVGTVFYISDSGGANAIQPLDGGSCVTGGGGCTIGVKIPATFTGQGFITIGRPAKPGETYEHANSAFAPGEVLHCSGLRGARVATALPILKADKLTVVRWREESSGAIDATAPTSNYIADADPVAAGTVMITTQPTPPPGYPAAYARAVNRGC
jgi:hypothetical protein